MSKRLSFLLWFSPAEEAVTAYSGETLLDVALRHKIDLGHSCGGNATCGTCRIIVESGLEQLPEREAAEAEIASDRGFSPEERLACQTLARPGLKIRVP